MLQQPRLAKEGGAEDEEQEEKNFFFFSSTPPSSPPLQPVQPFSQQDDRAGEVSSSSSLDVHFDFSVLPSKEEAPPSFGNEGGGNQGRADPPSSAGVHTLDTLRDAGGIEEERKQAQGSIPLPNSSSTSLSGQPNPSSSSSSSRGLSLPSSRVLSSDFAPSLAISVQPSSSPLNDTRRDTFLSKEQKKDLDRRSRLLTYQLEQAELLGWISWFRFVHWELLLSSPLLLAAILSLYLSYCSRKAARGFPSSSSSRSSAKTESPEGRRERRGGPAQDAEVSRGKERKTRRSQEEEDEAEGTEGRENKTTQEEKKESKRESSSSSSSVFPKIPAHGAAVFAFLKETFEVLLPSSSSSLFAFSPWRLLLAFALPLRSRLSVSR